MNRVLQFLKLLRPVFYPTTGRLSHVGEFTWFLSMWSTICGTMLITAMLVHGDPSTHAYHLLGIVVAIYIICIVPTNIALNKGGQDE